MQNFIKSFGGRNAQYTLDPLLVKYLIDCLQKKKKQKHAKHTILTYNVNITIVVMKLKMSLKIAFWVKYYDIFVLLVNTLFFQSCYLTSDIL